MREVLIDVLNIDISYDDSKYKKGKNENLLNNISFCINPGKIHCLMGANGCGKTTLINCLLGMHKANSGKIMIGNSNINELKPSDIAKKLSFVPQIHDRTFPYTVEQIVLMGRSIYADPFFGPDSEDLEIVHDMLFRTGILHLANRPYTQISGGEMQLVMLARALAQQTSVIIMDEPSAHLDFRNELIFMETVAELIRREDSSVLMATHSPNQPFFFERNGIDVEVFAIAERKLMYSGTPNEILTEENIRKIYNIDANLIYDRGIKQIVPIKALADNI